MLWLRSRFSGESLFTDSGIVAFITIMIANGLLVTYGIRVLLGSATSASSDHDLIELFEDFCTVGSSFEELVEVRGINSKG